MALTPRLLLCLVLATGAASAAPSPEGLVREVLAAQATGVPPLPRTPAHLRALAALEAGDSDRAERIAAKLGPAPMLRARIDLARGRAHAAAARLRRLPGARPRLLRAIALVRAGRSDAALRLLTAAPPQRPSGRDEERLALAAAELLVAAGRGDEALRRLAPLPPRPVALRLAADALRARGRPVPALALRLHLAATEDGLEGAAAASAAARALAARGEGAQAASVLARALEGLERTRARLRLPATGDPEARLAAACRLVPGACAQARIGLARVLARALATRAGTLRAAAARLDAAALLAETRPRALAAAARRLAPCPPTAPPLPDHPLERRLALLLEGPPIGERHRLYLGLARWATGRKPRRPWWQGGEESAAVRELDAVERALATLDRDAPPPYAGLPPRLRALAGRLRRTAAELEGRRAALLAATADTLAAALAAHRRTIDLARLHTAARLLALARTEPSTGRGLTVAGEGTTVGSLLRLRLRTAPPPRVDYGAAVRTLRALAAGPDLELARPAAWHLAAALLAAADTAAAGADPPPGVPAAAGEAATRYAQLAASEPDPQRRARLRYDQAHAAELAGDPTAAVDALEKAAVDAKGELAGEIAFRLGEIRFAAGDYAAAARRYGAAVEATPRSLAVHARYKLGWARFKLGEHAEAIAQFLAVLAAEMPEGGTGAAEDPRRQRIKDTLRVLALALDRQGGPPALAATLARTPLPFESTLYRALGDRYLARERYTDAAAAFLAYTRRHPRDPAAPAFAARAVEAYLAGGFTSLAWSARAALARDFGPGSAFWRNLDAPVRQQVAGLLSPHVEALARRAHAAFQDGADTAADAARWYRMLLALVPSQERGRYRLRLGELLEAAGKTEEALAAYRAAAWDDPPHAETAEAGYAVLALLERRLPGERERFLEAATRFLARFPGDARATEVRTRLAEERLAAGDAAGAVAAAEDLQQAPGPLRARALAVIATVRARAGDRAGAEAALRSALAADPASGEIRRRLALAVYRGAEALRDEGRPDEAAARFLEAAHILPEGPVAAPAALDAATLLLRLERWQEAAEVLEALRRRGPAPRLAARIPAKLALAYERLGRPRAAARELLREASSTQDSAVARAARLHAAELLAGAGARDEAVAVLREYLRRHPQPLAEALAARWRLAGLVAATGNGAARARELRRLLAAYRKADGSLPEAAHTLAARAALALGDEARARFEAIRLTRPLRRSLARKRRALEEALAHYRTAAATGVAGIATEATYRAAELYRRLARDVLASQRPPGLDAAALEQYEVLLEEQALPFEDEAIALHEVNLARVRGGVWDRWVAASLDALRALYPARYDRTEEVEHHVPLLAPHR